MVPTGLSNSRLQASGVMHAPLRPSRAMLPSLPAGLPALPEPTSPEPLQRPRQRSMRTPQRCPALAATGAGAEQHSTAAHLCPAFISSAATPPCFNLARSRRPFAGATSTASCGHRSVLRPSHALSAPDRRTGAGLGADPSSELSDAAARPAKRRPRGASTPEAGGASSGSEAENDGGAGVGTEEPQRRRRQPSSHEAAVRSRKSDEGAEDAVEGRATAVAVPAQSSDLSEMKVTELQAALQALGLPRTGRKADLVERLTAAMAARTAAGPHAATTAAAPSRSVIISPSASAASDRGERPLLTTSEEGEEAPQQRVRLLRRRRDDGVGAAETRGGTARVGRAAPARAPQAPAATAASNEGGGGGGDDPLLQELFGTLQLDVTVDVRGPSPGDRTTAGGARGGASPEAAAAPVPEAAPRVRPSLPGYASRAPRELQQVQLEGLPVEGAAAVLGRIRAQRTAGPDAGGAAGRMRRVPAAGADAAASPSAAASDDDAPRLRTRGREEEAAAAATTSGGEGQGEDEAEGQEAAAVAAAPRQTRERERARRSEASGQGAKDLGPAPDLDNLPPWPEMFMGQLLFPEEVALQPQEDREELLLSNRLGITLTSLGSAVGAPTARRGLGCLAMVRTNGIFLFDAGDDTQRQLAGAYHVKPSKVFRVFLTSLAAESVLGLPGLMCTINMAREKGHELSDIPVHVYGPPGTAAFLASVMHVSQTLLEITTVVHEVSPGPVSEDQATPYLYSQRSRIWRVVMPPDQLNPRGGVDASLLAFAPDQGRGQKKKGRNASGGVLSHDPRAGFLPWPPLQPGDPTRRDVDPLSMTWTLELDLTARAVINLLPGPEGQPPTLAYTVVEAERAGGLVLERAVAAGVAAGRDYSLLKAGETVTNSWGQPVPPSLVLSPNRPGRRVVVLGNTPDPTPLAAGAPGSPALPHLVGADVLVAGAVFPKAEGSIAAQMGGCTADVLGETARRLGVRHVLLSRFDSRRFDTGGPSSGRSSQKGQGEGGDGDNDGDDDDGGYAAGVVAEVEAAVRGGGSAAGPRGAAGRAGRAAAVAAAGDRQLGARCRRVAVLEDLRSAVLEKNEGLLEP